jgi:hypothetical protein
MATKPCEWTNQREAFAAFAGFTEKTQSAGHIKPLHWYVACRLVLEGGFDPDDIKPRPPFIIGSKRYGLPKLIFDPTAARGGEATVLGGLKTKNVDVVVTRRGIGPVLAISCKGTTGAFRNLTNRMEELIGDCTNLHISYPTLVLGYLHLLRANRQIGEVVDLIENGDEEEAEGTEGAEETEHGASLTLASDTASDSIGAPNKRALTRNDMAFDDTGVEVTPEIRRFGIAVSRLGGRSGIRDDLTRYESLGLALVEAETARQGEVIGSYPDSSGLLDIEGFFERLYSQYDERFVYGAPLLVAVTRRLEWSPESPALNSIDPDYSVRLGAPRLPTHRKAT